MKFQTQSSKKFASALATVAKCIQSKNAVAILDNILLHRNAEGQFLITAGSHEAMLTIPVDISIVEGKWEKDICLPAKVIIPYLNSLPDITVTFDVSDRGNLAFSYCTTIGERTKAGKADISYFEATEYPSLNTQLPTPDTHIVLPGKVLADQLTVAVKFTASDELRRQMNCVALDIKYDECVFVASDGHRLYKHVHSNNPQTGGSNFLVSGGNTVILFNKALLGVMQVFSQCAEVHIETDGRNAIVSADGMTYSMVLTEGKYPNYNSVIPHSTQSFTVNSKEALAVISRVALLGSSNSEMMSVSYDGSMFLTLRAEDIDFSTSAEDQILVTSANMKSNIRIGMKASTLRDCINACNADEVTFFVESPERAAVIKPADTNAQTLALCMPMLLNQ